MAHSQLCGGDVGDVMAAVLESDAEIENSSLDFSGHNIIHPRECCKFHCWGADPDHSVALPWARMRQLRHLKIVMQDCYCMGVGADPRCAPWMPSALYCNLFRGFHSLHCLHFDISMVSPGCWGLTMHDAYVVDAIGGLLGVQEGKKP